MSTDEQTLLALKEAGHRLTPQRLMVLSALRRSVGHVTAQEILDQVRASYPYIDASTVYRTLTVLKDLRMASEVRLADGEARYEWTSGGGHHHLVCGTCEAVADLDHEYLDGLGASLLDDYGFQADLDHFAIHGLCRACRQGQPAA